jgi:hypothetical protein
MESVLQTIQVDCPLCGKSHIYNLIIHRVKVLSMYEKKDNAKVFTRLFICPSKKEIFETRLTLDETTDWEILKIEIQK